MNLEQELKKVEAIHKLHDLIKNEEWTYGEIYVADFKSFLMGQIKKMFQQWLVKDLPAIEPHNLAETDPKFEDAERIRKTVGEAFSILSEMTIEEANKVLDTFQDAIAKSKGRKLGPITIEELEIKMPSKEDIISKHVCIS